MRRRSQNGGFKSHCVVFASLLVSFGFGRDVTCRRESGTKRQMGSFGLNTFFRWSCSKRTAASALLNLLHLVLLDRCTLAHIYSTRYTQTHTRSH